MKKNTKEIITFLLKRFLIGYVIGCLIGYVILCLMALFIIIPLENNTKEEKHPRMDNIQMLEETTTIETTTTQTTTTRTTTKIAKINIPDNKKEYVEYAKEYGNLNDTQTQCLYYLWQHESNWNPNDVNKTSGACGIPQAYPCNKIQNSEGSNDWKAQIRWGIKYINNRYKNPCSAWNHFKKKHWY